MKRSSWRSPLVIRIFLVAILCGAVGVGSYVYALHSQPADVVVPSAPVTTTTAVAKPAISFISAAKGDCLTWDYNGDVPTNVQQTDCASPHRFEITSREDLGLFPTSEFAEHAPLPTLGRQAQLREELCSAPTQEYLNSTFDSFGKYSIATILPPEEFWQNGDRTLLCGLQVTDGEGKVITTKGRAIDQDQSRIFEQGTCLALDAAANPATVECSKPHQLEVTAVLDLLPVFSDVVPTVEMQDAHLQKACTVAAREYLGSDDALYYSTLKPFWTTITSNSWAGGSHSVNCFINFPINGEQGPTLGELQGSAKETFTINGNPPEQRPERQPIVNPEELEKVDAPAPQ
ncbi:septum formation family protein [Corynebacterium sp. HS2168-gen11]|uniref:septum formation family protein n=1 Tax=Corynebacterium sp. HS2168-gen11 TaxID=2974027 RepID=UPI00216B585F|nr:septum formation family protein [Corynebacterium sp. HS2168-gen11]MCS4535956.1 septum formation family protein [Corynebacterium sp. HS2168-gen11]